jgi:LysR family transcriptional regulator, regulator for bpeEF and oprC
MDAFTEIGVFVRVVEVRSFTRAGRALGLTASGVSRVVSRLEERLGVRLLNRTTRSLSLTDDGAAYFERCSKIVSELEEANLAAGRSRNEPRGRLRVDAPTVLGRYVLGPAIPQFLAKYPELSVDFTVRDHLIDPIAEGVDVVVRMAELRESDLVSRKVGSMRIVLVGSPSYFAKRGRPTKPADLRSHDAIGFMSGGSPLPWRFRSDAGDTSLAVAGRLHTNSADALRAAALAGLGLIHVLEFHVKEDLKSGALEVVMGDYESPPRGIYALYARNKFAAPKVRVFLDFLAERLAGTTKASKAPRLRERTAGRSAAKVG